jgi:hypothetical protein
LDVRIRREKKVSLYSSHHHGGGGGGMDGWMDETKKRGETAADVVTQYK